LENNHGNKNFWKIYHENKIFLVNIPFYGNISKELGTLGISPFDYGDMPRDGGKSGKNVSNSTVNAVKGFDQSLSKPSLGDQILQHI
jgi:hypothetical protein